MRNLILAAACIGIAGTAYIAWPSSPEGDDKAAQDKEKRSRGSETIVTPRRMRSREAISDDILALPAPALPDKKIPFRSRRGDLPSTSEAEGRLSIAERAAMRASAAGRAEAPDGEVKGATGEQARKTTVARRMNQWVIDADKDADGALSRSEAELGGSTLRLVLSDFDAADKNGDERINKEELLAAIEAREARRKKRRQAQ